MKTCDLCNMSVFFFFPTLTTQHRDVFVSLQPHLAVGSNDYYMSIYSAEKRLR